MRILIIGNGNMGRGIATRLLAGDHYVTLYDVDPKASIKLAADLTQVKPDARITIAASAAEAVPSSEVVVLASWYQSNLEVARQLGSALEGKVVIDISNPLNDAFDGLVTEPGTSAAETIRAALPLGARIVKAFNTTFAPTLVEGDVAGQQLDVFIAGDDQSAKDTVASLARSGDLNPIDVGALDRARQLEGLALLGITLQSRLNTGFQTGWKLLMPVQAAA